MRAALLGSLKVENFVTPTFVAAGAVSPNVASTGVWGGTTTRTFALPAGIATNDILLACIFDWSSGFNGLSPVATGWTEVTPRASGNEPACAFMFWQRYAGGSAPSFTLGSNTMSGGYILAYRGCVLSGTPYEAAAGITNYQGFSAAVDDTNVTPVGPNRRIVGTIAGLCSALEGAPSFNSFGTARQFGFNAVDPGSNYMASIKTEDLDGGTSFGSPVLITEGLHDSGKSFDFFSSIACALIPEPS